jgi:predicted phage replisome organizer
MKGIDWIKIAVCMFEDEKMRLFDALEERDLIVYLWLRLLLQAGKVNDNGLIYLNENVPYTKEMLAVLFNRPINLVIKGLELLESFGMVEIYEDNVIWICNWEKHQNIEGMKKVREINKERTRNCRERKKNEYKVTDNKINNESCNNSNLNLSQICNGNVTEQKEKREKENKKKNLELDKKERELKDVSKDTSSYSFLNQNNFKASKVKSESVSRSYEDLKEKGYKLIRGLEENNVNVKGLTLNWILERLAIHEEKYIIMAINIAIRRNKGEINYITGILKNWLSEGYPKNNEEMEFKSTKEKAKLKFNNFEGRVYDYEDLEERLLGWKK